jgi:2,5-diamino-6-(ribosylamino)-4(3H)-pyrimidinone 5'-phosphate reductase
MKILLNCAMSVDGKIALPTREETKISNREDLERVHRMRNEVDAVLVGIGTILADDSKLTVGVKYAKVLKQPLRIVLDSHGRTPPTARVLNDQAKTLIVTNVSCSKTFPGVDVVRFGKDRVDIRALVEHLEKSGIRTMLIEGGETVMWSFFKEGLIDEVSVFVGSMIIGGRSSPTLAGGDGFKSIEEATRLKLIGCDRLGDGVLLRYEVIK